MTAVLPDSVGKVLARKKNCGSQWVLRIKQCNTAHQRTWSTKVRLLKEMKGEGRGLCTKWRALWVIGWVRKWGCWDVWIIRGIVVVCPLTLMIIVYGFRTSKEEDWKWLIRSASWSSLEVKAMSRNKNTREGKVNVSLLAVMDQHILKWCGHMDRINEGRVTQKVYRSEVRGWGEN